MEALRKSVVSNLVSQPDPQAGWQQFCAINERRRAIREFDRATIPDSDVVAILEQAQLAPSSGNLQPYRFHWIRDEQTKAAIAGACNGQRAANSAPTLLVITASTAIARENIRAQRAYLDHATHLQAKSKAYHHKLLRKFEILLMLTWLPMLSGLKALIGMLFPELTLLPVGAPSARHWLARSSLFAAQTLMLAASARGLDTCPMEGFNARAIARILKLPRGTVIPLVIAVGRRAPNARLEPRWRRQFEHGVVSC